MLLQGTDTLLQQLLTRDEFVSLEHYRESLPTRELLRPIISRLQSAGLPPSKDQLERAVRDVQSWGAGLMERAHEDGSDDVRSCEDAERLEKRSDEQLVAVLSQSLEEEQAAIARDYYRERAEAREKQRANSVRAGNAPCVLRQFNRSER
ncbi:MAG: hypothetical protein ACJ8OJ_21735 [Povalibacter sp.]